LPLSRQNLEFLFASPSPSHLLLLLKGTALLTALSPSLPLVCPLLVAYCLLTVSPLTPVLSALEASGSKDEAS